MFSFAGHKEWKEGGTGSVQTDTPLKLSNEHVISFLDSLLVS